MNKGKLNAYVCDALHITVTVDRDNGTTPFIIGCTNPGCSFHATSKMHKVSSGLTPTWEFYKMPDNEAEKLSPAEKMHHVQGGLFLRPIQSNIPEKEYNIDTELSINITAGQLVQYANVMAKVSEVNDQMSPTMLSEDTMAIITSARNKLSSDAFALIPTKYLEVIEETLYPNQN